MQGHTPVRQLSEEGEMRVAETPRQAGETRSRMDVIKKKGLVSPKTHTGNHTSQSTGRKTIKRSFSGPWASMQRSNPPVH